MKTLCTLVAAVLVAFGLAEPAAAQSTNTTATTTHSGTVVELFTSQGCSSCPPADALLGELARRKDIIALTFNVNYWDYLGWSDTLASPAYTDRQRAYAAAMQDRRVYTPEMVIGGSVNAVGSDRGTVMSAIDTVRHAGTQHLKIELARDKDHVIVRLPDGPAEVEATIWLVRYDHRQEVAIGRGENGGRTLTYHNVVRELTNLGLWNGKAKEISYMADDLTRGGSDGCAVIVQRGSHGPIIGAAAMDLEPQS
jgi:hypothetical protein